MENMWQGGGFEISFFAWRNLWTTPIKKAIFQMLNKSITINKWTNYVSTAKNWPGQEDSTGKHSLSYPVILED